MGVFNSGDLWVGSWLSSNEVVVIVLFVGFSNIIVFRSEENGDILGFCFYEFVVNMV